MRRIAYIILMAAAMFFACGADGFAQSVRQHKGAGSDGNKQLSVMDRQYLFGMAISYADSITILTNVASIDGIQYDKRTKSPVGLELYTESLRNYLAQQGKHGYLCSTFICSSMKEAEKKILVMRNKVAKQKCTRLQGAGDFRYEYINTEHIFSNAGQEDEEDF